MQFSDTTNNSGLIQSFEFWTGLGLAQVSGDTAKLKEATRLINTNYHKATTIIFESMDDWDFDDPNHANTGFIKSYNLTKDTQYVELPTTDKILKVRRVEVSYDGSTWVKAEPMDLSEYSNAVTQTSHISSDFEKSKPFYDLVGKYIYLYPIPDAAVTNGLKVWVTREIDEFATTDTTQEPGFDEPFHEILAVGAALDYAMAKGLATAGNIASKYSELEARMRRYYGNKEADTKYMLKPAYINYE